MRVAGEIDHPFMKITIFKMDNKLSVKFETGLFEQIFKFRTGENLESPEDIKKMVDQEFINQVENQFILMNKSKFDALNRYAPVEEDNFPVII